jgi:hypothetical protein
MHDRLPAHLEAAGLLRHAESQGGFGMIVRKGDPDRGALLLLIANRGEHQACMERALGPDGRYGWQIVGPGVAATGAELADWSQERVTFDSDIWLIELDIPLPERFIAETTANG